MYKNRSQTLTIQPNQELPFQADWCVYVALSSGTITMGGSAANVFGGNLLLSAGTKLHGPEANGQREPIGLVYLRNEGTTPAYIEIITANGEIERDPFLGGTQIIQRNGVYGLRSDILITGAAGNVLSLTVDTTSNSKRLALLRWGIVNPGYRAAAVVGNASLYLVTGFSGGTDIGGLHTRRDMAYPAPSAALKQYPTVAGPVVKALDQIHFDIPATAMGKTINLIRDFTNDGTSEPFYSVPGGGAGTGFVIAFSHDINGLIPFLEWQEV